MKISQFTQTLTSPKPLPIKFDRIDGFIRDHGDEFRQLVLFNHRVFDKIWDKINFL